ncbi:MAG: LLM class F420-dependent oxidoreductase [Dehalococcoidia bacterium]
MQLGVTFPQIEIGSDPGVIREYAQTAEGLGYQHLLVYDHVLGVSTAGRPNWRGAYSADDPFHEPMVLFGYLAAVTRTIELVTGVLVLPQRQTALAAKQIAEVDVLSGGRLRLGVGIGWNSVEYEALGMDFGDRGRRFDEQLSLLEALLTTPNVRFEGRWHRVTDAGINPLPPRRQIPLWFGGRSEAALRRAARLGDGWFPLAPTVQASEVVDQFRQFVADAGRDPTSVGIEASVHYQGGEDAWVRRASAWREAGATHLSVNTMRSGLRDPRAHIDAIRRFKEVAGPATA